MYCSSKSVKSHILSVHGKTIKSPNKRFWDSSTEDDDSDDVDFKYYIKKSKLSIKKKTFKCNICHQVLSSQVSLEQHKFSHEQDQNQRMIRETIPYNPKPFECPCCDLRFESAQKVTGHVLRKHKSVSPMEGLCHIMGDFECPLCSMYKCENFEFFKRHIFESHMPEHEVAIVS